MSVKPTDYMAMETNPTLVISWIAIVLCQAKDFLVSGIFVTI